MARMIPTIRFLALSAVFLTLIAGCAEIESAFPVGDILHAGAGIGGGSLDEKTAADGLREALRVGAERTVTATSMTDGFLKNSLIRIALPEQFDTMARTLRSVGLGAQVDALEVSMNRAAERAAGEAVPVFANAISQMTVSDALQIVNGGETAATSYFRKHTSDALRSRFTPIVHNKMEEVGLYRVYNQIVASYTALPLVTKPSVDLDGYVTDKALAGLFTTLASEERRIRQDPAARTSDLLRRVFGRASSY